MADAKSDLNHDTDAIKKMTLQTLEDNFPQTRGFDPDQRIEVIRNDGGPLCAGGDRICGTGSVNAYCNYVSAYWDDFGPETIETLLSELGVDDSVRPVRVSLMRRE